MKLKLLKPIYLNGEVLTEGKTFETLEQHGRELIRKGYAEASNVEQTVTDAPAEADAKAAKPSDPEPAEDKAPAEADAKAKVKTK